MHNYELKTAIKRSGFFQYEIAAAMGISESYFSRQMARREFNKNEVEKVLLAIEKLEIERAEQKKS